MIKSIHGGYVVILLFISLWLMLFNVYSLSISNKRIKGNIFSFRMRLRYGYYVIQLLAIVLTLGVGFFCFKMFRGNFLYWYIPTLVGSFWSLLLIIIGFFSTTIRVTDTSIIFNDIAILEIKFYEIRIAYETNGYLVLKTIDKNEYIINQYYKNYPLLHERLVYEKLLHGNTLSL